MPTDMEVRVALRDLADYATTTIAGSLGEVHRAARRRQIVKRGVVTLSLIAVAIGGAAAAATLGSEHDTTVAIDRRHVPSQETSPTVAPTSAVDTCVAKYQAQQDSMANPPAAGTIRVLDRTLGPTAIDIRQFCTEREALASPRSDVEVQYYYDAGHVAANYFERVDTPLPDGGVRTTFGRQLSPDEVRAMFAGDAP